MSCRLDIKNAIYKSIRENVENNKKIIPRNTYQFVRDNLIKINSESDNSNTKVKSDELRRQQARKIAVSIATAITKLYKGSVYFTIDSSKQFKPVTILMTLNPAYVEHEYRKLPLSEQTDPLDFNPPAALKNEGVSINTKRDAKLISNISEDEEYSNLSSNKTATPIKEGVKELFDSIPELANIGTLEQYSQYLDSVFPDSAVKDIKQHATEADFESFTKEGSGRLGKGFYFSDFGNNYIEGENVKKKLVLLNIKNPLNIQGGQFMKDVYKLLDDRNQSSDDIDAKIQAQKDINNQYKQKADALVGDKNGVLNSEIKVFEPEQIHILGSKQDIEGFKKFTAAPSKVDEKGQGLLFGLNSVNNIEFHVNTLNVISKFLENVGVEQRLVPQFLSQDGTIIEGALAASNFIKGTVDIIDDLKLRPAAWNKLPEEAAHWWYRLLQTNSPLKKALLEANQTKAKQDSLKGGAYSIQYNESDTLTEEAIGQLIAETIKRIETKNAAPKDYSFLKKFIDWVNSIISIFNLTEEDVFEIAAMKILSSDMSDLMTLEEYNKLNNIVNFTEVLTNQSVAPIDYTLIEDLGKVITQNIRIGFTDEGKEIDGIQYSWSGKNKNINGGGIILGKSSPAFKTKEELDNWVTTNIPEHDERQKAIIQEVIDNEKFYEKLLKGTFKKKTKYLSKTVRKYYKIVDSNNLNKLPAFSPQLNLQASIITKELSAQEKQLLTSTNNYTEIGPTLKVLPDILKKYNKQGIVLSESIKIDGAKKQDLNILNNIKDLIKKENPNKKTITSEEFVNEVHNWLQTNYLLGFAEERAYNSYRIDQTFEHVSDRVSTRDFNMAQIEQDLEDGMVPVNEQQQLAEQLGLKKQNPEVYHNKISLRFNNTYHLKHSHFALSPSAWGNLTYFYTGKSNQKDAVLLHEIQNDNIETLRDFKADEKGLENEFKTYLFGLNNLLNKNLSQIELNNKKIDKLLSPHPIAKSAIEKLLQEVDINMPDNNFIFTSVKNRVREKIDLYKASHPNGFEFDKLTSGISEQYSNKRKWQNFLNSGGIKSILSEEDIFELEQILNEVDNSREITANEYLEEENQWEPGEEINATLQTKKARFGRRTFAIRDKINKTIKEKFGIDYNLVLIMLDAPAIPLPKAQRSGRTRWVDGQNVPIGNSSNNLNKNIDVLIHHNEDKIKKDINKKLASLKKEFVIERNSNMAYKFNEQFIKITYPQFETMMSNYRDNIMLLQDSIKKQSELDAVSTDNSITEEKKAILRANQEFEFDKLREEAAKAKTKIEKEYGKQEEKIKEILEIEMNYFTPLIHHLLQKHISTKGKNIPMYFSGYNITKLTQGNDRTAMIYAGKDEINTVDKKRFTFQNTEYARSFDNPVSLSGAVQVGDFNFVYDQSNNSYKKVRLENGYGKEIVYEGTSKEYEDEYNNAVKEYDKAYQQATEQKAKEIKYEAAQQIGLINSKESIQSLKNGLKVEEENLSLEDEDFAEMYFNTKWFNNLTFEQQAQKIKEQKEEIVKRIEGLKNKINFPIVSLEEGIKKLNEFKKQSKQNLDRAVNTIMNISNNRPIETGAIYNAMTQIPGVKLIWKDSIEGIKNSPGGYLVDLSEYNYTTPVLFQLPQSPTSGYNKYQTEANEETIEKVKTLLAKLGVSVEITDKVMEEFGANALIDLSRRLIQMVEGKESESLTEEAMHLLAALLPEDILADLLSKITSYQIYKDTFNQYKNHPSYQNEDGTPNIDKIKFEAVGKLLAEFYIGRAQNLGIDEINAAKSVWSRILDWIKNIFSRQMNEFEKVIQGLEDGTLTLLSTPSRQDKFLQAAFDWSKVKGENLAEVISHGRVKTDVMANSSDKKIQILYNLRAAIETAKNDDIRISSYKKNIRLATKEPFSEATRKINNALEAQEVKESALNAINYFISLNGITKNISARSEVIREIISTGKHSVEQNDGTFVETALTDDEKYWHVLEITKINKIADIYVKQLEEFRKIWVGNESMGSEFAEMKEVINLISGTASNTVKDNQIVGDNILRELLQKHIGPKTEGFIRDQRREELYLIREHPSLKGKDKIRNEKKLEEVRELIKNPPFSVDNIVKIITTELPEDSINSLQDFISKWMEGGLTHFNEAIQAISNVLENDTRTSRRTAEANNIRIQKLFDEYSQKFGISAKAYDKFLKKVNRFSFNSNKGELEEYEEYVLLNTKEQWKYDNMQDTIAYLRYKVKQGVPISHIEDTYEKVFGTKLQVLKQTDKQGNPLSDKQNYDLTLLEIQKQLNNKYGQNRYTQEYLKIRNILTEGWTETSVDENGIESSEFRSAILEAKTPTGDPISVYDARKPYIDALQEANTDLDDAIGALSMEMALVAVDEALKKLQLLGSIYSNGEMKKGDDLLIAQAINEYAKQKRDNKVDEFYITNSAKVEWKEQKEKIDKLPIDSPERILWYKINTTTEISQDYYDRQGDISTRLANLLDEIKPKTLEQKERIDDLYYDLAQLKKGKKDGDGVIVGSDFSEKEVKVIKEIELALKEIKDAVDETSNKISKEDKAEIKSLLAELEEIQSSYLTTYWEDSFEMAKFKIDSTLSQQEQDEALQKSNFIKNNTINVTDKYNTSTYKIPDTIIRIGNKFYQPLSIWKQTVPSKEFKTINKESRRWHSYKVSEQKDPATGKKRFINDEYETIQGRIALNDEGETLTKFGSQEYLDLQTRDKEFVNKLRDIYYELQMEHPEYARQGDSMPKMNAEGTQRIVQRFTNAKNVFNNVWSKNYWSNIIDLNPTKLETVYGEGKEETINDNELHLTSKFTSNYIPLSRQNKDLFYVFTTYNIETQRSKSMKKLIPSLNAIKKIAAPENKSKTTHALNLEIDKRVNLKTRRDKGFMRVISQWADGSMKTLAFTRVGMPNITQAVKNTVNGIWALRVKSPYIAQFSEESISKATLNALNTTGIVFTQQFSSKPSKEMAIIRRLEVVTGLDIRKAANNQKTMLLKMADAFGYTLGGLKTFSEQHLDLISYELLKGKYLKENGISLEDSYSFIDGQLIPLSISEEQENKISQEHRNMASFIHGDFKGDNASLAKAYFVGRVLTFMKGFVYNPAIGRFGKKRYLSTGQGLEGFYRVYTRLVREDPKNLLSLLYPKTSGLTLEEKGAVWSMYKDFTVINTLGVALYFFSQFVKQSGGDDDDNWLEWYALMLARKTYAEMSFFNPAEFVLSPLKQLFLSDKVPGKRLSNFVKYNIATPAANYVMQAVLPVDWKSFAIGNDEAANEKDEFYSLFKDNFILYDFVKGVNLRPEVFYPKKALGGFELYDKSIFEYQKGKGEGSSGSSSTRRKTKRKSTRRN